MAMMVVPCPADAVTMVIVAMVAMAVADADMNAGTDAADMNSDANVGARSRRAQQAQCKYRGNKSFHGSLRR
jgi:hypothetical protein